MARVESTERQPYRRLLPGPVQKSFAVLDVSKDVNDLQRFLNLATSYTAEQEFEGSHATMFGCVVQRGSSGEGRCLVWSYHEPFFMFYANGM